MLLDQFMCIRNVLWRKSLFNSKKAILSCMSVITVFCLANAHLNLSFEKSKNGTNENSTFAELLESSSPTFTFWAKVNINIKIK